jgi:hypothetical protein
MLRPFGNITFFEIMIFDTMKGPGFSELCEAFLVYSDSSGRDIQESCPKSRYKTDFTHFKDFV